MLKLLGYIPIAKSPEITKFIALNLHPNNTVLKSIHMELEVKLPMPKTKNELTKPSIGSSGEATDLDMLPPDSLPHPPQTFRAR